MILVTGGAGYIGSVLVPKLLEQGHSVTVLDCFFFGQASLAPVHNHPHLRLIEADIRDHEQITRVLSRGDFSSVIHLAAISNDPSSEIDPELTRAVNRDALEHLFVKTKEAGVPRMIYASSASVYGLKEDPDVTEDLPLEPLTLYARYKAEGEEILNGLVDDDFCGVSVRAATVCGYSPRLRLDLTINILTEHAINRGQIRVFGGTQQRPNIHVRDLTDFYVSLVTAPSDRINGQAFNVTRENSTVMGLAEMIRAEIDPELLIETVPTDDNRSYRLSGEKVARVLGYHPAVPLAEAVRELRSAFREGRITDPSDPVYRNVELMNRRPDFRTWP